MSTWKFLIVVIALSTIAVSQARVTVQRVRLAEWASYSLADRKVLPDIAGRKGHSLNSVVPVHIVISKTGDVIDARAFKGDPDLFKRC